MAAAHVLQPLAAAYTVRTAALGAPTVHGGRLVSCAASQELGIVLKARGRVSEAERTLRKALTFTPREYTTYLHLGALVPSREAVQVLRAATELQPAESFGYIALARAARDSGDLAAAQEAAEAAAEVDPTGARLSAVGGVDFRDWHGDYARAREAAAALQRDGGNGDNGGGGIGYETNLRFPWSGAELRALATYQVDAARARLPAAASFGIRHAWPDALAGGRLRVGYLGSLSDEPQLRAMSALFAGADARVARFDIHPVTATGAASRQRQPDYRRHFLESLTPGGAELRDGPASSAHGLAMALGGSHIVLDGLWRKECTQPESAAATDSPGGALGGGSSPGGLACVLLLRPAPITFAVLAAPVTAGGGHVDYTLADSTCAPPRLSRAFAERLVLLPAGAYPFSHASWARVARTSGDGSWPSEPSRRLERLPAGALVLASFVQRWKVTPRVWDAWANVLLRVPRAILWILQHPLDGRRRALSRRLAAELGGVRHSRMLVMGREPLERHVHRTGLADLVLDTWPYTAHTTVADAIWHHGPPWLALGASDDRMDSLLSSAALTYVGWAPLRAGTLREMEDAATQYATGSAAISSLQRRRDADGEQSTAVK